MGERAQSDRIQIVITLLFAVNRTVLVEIHLRQYLLIVHFFDRFAQTNGFRGGWEIWYHFWIEEHRGVHHALFVCQQGVHIVEREVF